MSSSPSDCLSIMVQTVSSHPAIWGSAGQKLISMLIVQTNVLWSGCHFWVDSNCPPELNCTVNYHIIAFWGVIYGHIGAGLLQLVGCGISAAGLTSNTAGCYSTGKHQSFNPPSPPSSCAFLLSFICSSSFHLTCLLSFILCFYLSVSLQAMLSLTPLDFPSSIIYLSCIWSDDSEVPSGVQSSSASFMHTQGHTCEHSHLFSLSICTSGYPVLFEGLCIRLTWHLSLT